MVTRVLDVIGLALSCGETVSIRNFGRFEPRLKGASTGVNPKTGARVEIPEKFAVSFIAAPALKARLNPEM